MNIKNGIVRQYNTGETLMYLGRPYKLVRKKALSARKGHVALTGEQILLYGRYESATEIQEVLEKWYQEKALIWISRRISYYEKIIGVKSTKLSLRNTKTRWGSCSSQRHIMINWKLIMAPEDVLDYVICHELCHIRQMNHSKAFWSLVEEFMPDWKEKKEWLREHGHTLEV